jgi:hypothetical protein
MKRPLKHFLLQVILERAIEFEEKKYRFYEQAKAQVDSSELKSIDCLPRAVTIITKEEDSWI